MSHITENASNNTANNRRCYNTAVRTTTGQNVSNLFESYGLYKRNLKIYIIYTHQKLWWLENERPKYETEIFGTKENTSIAKDACLRHIIILDIN